MSVMRVRFCGDKITMHLFPFLPPPYFKIIFDSVITKTHNCGCNYNKRFFLPENVAMFAIRSLLPTLSFTSASENWILFLLLCVFAWFVRCFKGKGHCEIKIREHRARPRLPQHGKL